MIKRLCRGDVTVSIKAAHIQELRTVVEDAAARFGFSSGSYTDPILTDGMTIRREHVEELRQRIEALAGN